MGRGGCLRLEADERLWVPLCVPDTSPPCKDLHLCNRRPLGEEADDDDDGALQRPALRGARPDAVSDLHGHHGSDTGARHRGEHGRVHARGRRAAITASLRRGRPIGLARTPGPRRTRRTPDVAGPVRAVPPTGDIAGRNRDAHIGQREPDVERRTREDSRSGRYAGLLQTIAGGAGGGARVHGGRGRPRSGAGGDSQ